MDFKKVFYRAVSLICLLGFLVQIQQVSQLYFRFQTTTRTSFQVREINNYQLITYWLKFLMLINRKKDKGFEMSAQLSKTLDEYLR